MTFTRDECGSCHAGIVWAVTAANGKRMPVDHEPSDTGNVLLIAQDYDPPVAVIVPTAKRHHHEGKLRTSHFVTCPDAGSWRKRDGQVHA